MIFLVFWVGIVTTKVFGRNKCSLYFVLWYQVEWLHAPFYIIRLSYSTVASFLMIECSRAADNNER